MKKIVLVLFLAACFIAPNVGTQEVIAQDGSYPKDIWRLKITYYEVGGKVVTHVGRSFMGCEGRGGSCLPTAVVVATRIKRI